MLTSFRFESKLMRLLLALVGTVWLCVTPRPLHAQTPPDPPPPAKGITPSTRIAPGSVLSLVVADEPQLTGAFPVDENGQIRLMLSDATGESREEWTVTVGGLTMEQARAAVRESVERFLKNPEVSLFISRLPKLNVEVIGAARKQGKLDLELNARLSDALLAAVYLPNADLANIRILRREKLMPPAANSGPKTADVKTALPRRTIAVNFEAFQRGDSLDDPHLETGDSIVIPALPENHRSLPLQIIAVWGEVGREIRLPWEKGLTVKAALAKAGGVKRETADSKKILLTRAEDASRRVLELDKIEAEGGEHDLLLGPGDIIDVLPRDRSLRFAVQGAVMNPSTYVIQPGETVKLLEAIRRAGGPSKDADRSKGILLRGYLMHPDKPEPFPFDYDKVLKGDHPNVPVAAGDLIAFNPKPKRRNIFQQLLPALLRFLPIPLPF